MRTWRTLDCNYRQKNRQSLHIILIALQSANYNIISITKKATLFKAAFPNITVVNYFTASFRALPGLNAGTFDAGISISAPVCGLRPLRAARSRTSKLPKPIN